MTMDDRMNSLLAACHAVDNVMNRPLSEPGELQHFVQETLAAAVLPLPRLHRRLRLPIELMAQFATELVDVQQGYERFALPRSLHGISARQLEQAPIRDAVEALRVAWHDLLQDGLDAASFMTLSASLAAEGWLSRIDPGDFPVEPVESTVATGWDASVQAALASLPAELQQAERLALLLGLWAGAGRIPQLPADWLAAEAWIAGSRRVSTVADLASARVWTMSHASPLYSADDPAAVEAFVAWAYRRAATWPTFVSPDPQIHSRLRAAPRLTDHAEMWPAWIKAAVAANRLDEPASLVEPVRAAVTTDALLEELNSMVGLDAVKAELASIVNLAKMSRDMAEQGHAVAPLDLNMVFLGNPGTGKTTVARLYARILRSLNILSTGAFVEATRADLVSQYAGGTAEKTRALIASASGGVLFIDEAYALVEGQTGGVGKEALAEIVAAMEKHRGSLVVIVAGYPGPMHQFLDGNPGLASRFRKPVTFANMQDGALLEALLGMAEREGFRIADAALPELRIWIAAIPRGASFGNVREMRTLLGVLKQNAANRYAADASTQLAVIEKEDVPSVGPGRFDEKAFQLAMGKVQALTGVDSLKTMLAQLADQSQHARLLKEHGAPVAPIDIGHMAFVGNPGTGKTTAAELLGEVLASLGLLRGGHVHSVSQADLKGEYMGQTGPKVRNAIRQALGGVLFIDEAYSLMPNHPEDSYAHDAIATLVDEMERNRDQLVVVMAGYPDDMEKFFEANAGLKSRIKRTIDFADFDRDQLRSIAESMARGRHMRLSPEAAELVATRVAAVKARKGFANARTVRNLLEQSIARQNSRVVAMAAPTTQQLTMIEVEDIGTVDLGAAMPIGFI